MEKIRNSIKPFNQEEVIKAFMGASYCRNMMWKNSEFISSNLIEYLINRQDKSSALLTIEESDNLANYLKKRKIDIDKSYVEKFEEYVKNCSV